MAWPRRNRGRKTASSRIRMHVGSVRLVQSCCCVQGLTLFVRYRTVDVACFGASSTLHDVWWWTAQGGEIFIARVMRSRCGSEMQPWLQVPHSSACFRPKDKCQSGDMAWLDCVLCNPPRRRIRRPSSSTSSTPQLVFALALFCLLEMVYLF